MSYASLSDTQGLIAKFPVGATSKPNTAEANSIIDDVSNEIDTRLAGAGYTVPITTPDYLLGWCKALNTYGAAAAILKSMFPDSVGTGETPAYAFWESRYKDGLTALTTTEAAGGIGAAYVAPSTYLTRNPDSEEALGDIAEPFFTRSKVF